MIFKQFREDIDAVMARDPAARSRLEVALCYPGLHALIFHRMAHAAWDRGWRVLGRFLSHLGRLLTGIEIHPGARIGRRVFIDHGMGVVIGETAEIGERVRVYQAVTLGAKRFPTDAEGHVQKGAPRHPIVEDDVVIYAGATILGRVTIGRGSTIGGNVWLTRSVPAGSNVSQAAV
jgi:serine O-acetyltransferase